MYMNIYVHTLNWCNLPIGIVPVVFSISFSGPVLAFVLILGILQSLGLQLFSRGMRNGSRVHIIKAMQASSREIRKFTKQKSITKTSNLSRVNFFYDLVLHIHYVCIFIPMSYSSRSFSKYAIYVFTLL